MLPVLPRLSNLLISPRLLTRTLTMTSPIASTSSPSPSPIRDAPPRALLLPTSPPSALASSLETASALLHASLPVAFPTETVYGLGASALSATAVQRIFEAKGRPSDNPLIVHVSSREMLEGLLPTRKRDGKADVPRMFEALMDRFWPGPLSLVFPLSHLSEGKGKGKAEKYDAPRLVVAEAVTAGQPSLCIRMPSHPLALKLIAESNLPLAGPSANLSSRPSPTSAAHVIHDLGEGRGLGAVLDGGECEVGVESTVVDWVPPLAGKGEKGAEGAVRVLRAGGVSVEEIEACLREAGFATSSSASTTTTGGKNGEQVKVYSRDFRSTDLEDKPTTPGMKYKHYAPGNAKVILVKPVPSAPSSVDEEEGDAFPLPSLQDLIQLTALTHSSVTVNAEGRTVEAKFRVGLMLTDETLVALKATSSPLPLSPSSISSHSDASTSPAAYHLVTLPPPPPSLFSTLSIGEDSNLPSLDEITILSFPLGSQQTPIEAAQRLFGGLRLFDSLPAEEEEGQGGAKGVDLILVEAVREEGVGLAVMERARKAAGGTERGGEMEFLL